jgi:predicted sulfurtransferase
MNGRELVEVGNSADAVGLACLRTASKQCSDCGAELCEFHAETCAMCRAVFCPPCLSFHQDQHPKAASADREQPRERKSA